MMNTSTLYLSLALCWCMAGCNGNKTTSSTSQDSTAASNSSVSSAASTTTISQSSDANVITQISNSNTNVVGPPLAASSNAMPYVGTLGGPNNAYTLVGRFDLTVPASPRFSLPNSKIGGTFTGDSLGLMLMGDGADYLSVFIDNGPEHVVATSPNTTMTLYPVATGLGGGTHTAWFSKRTESYEVSQIDPNVHTGTLTFGGFALATTGTMGAVPKPRSRLIIAVGDSGFTGYGAGQLITATQNCVFSPNTQNALISVPAKLADLLSAEVINVSGSGKGIAASAYDPANPNNQLPAMWQMAVPYSTLPAYSFESLPVDAIVLDGGSDDLVGSYGSGAFASQADFVAKYTALLANMRSHYPTAIIVGIINPNAIKTDKTLLTQAITAAVSARVTAGDTRVYSYDYFAQDPNGPQSYNDADAALSLGHGCQGHPSDAGAAFLAGRLATFLRSKQSVH